MSRQDLRAEVLSVCREHLVDGSVDREDIIPALGSAAETVRNEDWATVARGRE